jgi:hypothetical protein
VLSVVKELLLIALSLVIDHDEKLGLLNSTGFSLCLFGVYLHHKHTADSQSLSRAAYERVDTVELPLEENSGGVKPMFGYPDIESPDYPT